MDYDSQQGMKNHIAIAICCILLRSSCAAEVIDIFPLKNTGGRIELLKEEDQEHLVWRDASDQRRRIFTLKYPLQSGILESPKGGQIAFVTGSQSAGTWPVVVDLGTDVLSARAPLGSAKGEGIGPVLEAARAAGVTRWSAEFPVAHVYSKIAGWTKEGDWLIRVDGDGELRQFGVRVPHDNKLMYLASDSLPPSDIAGLSVVRTFTSYSGSGTGFFISDNGLLATALHVVDKVSRPRRNVRIDTLR